MVQIKNINERTTFKSVGCGIKCNDVTLVIKAIATTRTEGKRVKDSITRTSEGGHRG